MPPSISRLRVVTGTRAWRLVSAAALAAIVVACPVALSAVPQAQAPGKKVPPPVASKLFDSSQVQDIRLEMKRDDWETLKANYAENSYYPADLHWKDHVVPTVGVRSRGSGSRNAAKPALRVDINRYVDQTFLKLKSFVLANAFQDPSMMRQRVAMTLSARMGLPAPRVVHARVYVNGDYIGLYELIESIDKVMLPRVFGETEDGRKEHDGYLFEYRWQDIYRWEYLGKDLEPYALRFEPKTHETDAPVDLYGPIEEAVRMANTYIGLDFERAAAEYFDLNHLATFLAVESFSADRDGFLGDWGVNNTYLYRFTGQKRSALIPWDRDLAFSDAGAEVIGNTGRNVLSYRALGAPGIRRAYFDALLACAAMAMTPESPQATAGWLEAEVLREAAQIREAVYADHNKPYTSAEFDEAVAELAAIARARGPFVVGQATQAVGRLGTRER